MTAGRSLADDGRRLSATERRSGHAAAWAACGIFSIAIGATQLGSLEHEVINMDEATFIVMAKDVLNGNLPYVELFDLKPPMLFFMLAAAMASFGESLLTVRLFGALCVLTSCMAVFAVARRSVEPTPATLAALLLVAVQSVEYGQYLSTELPATAMLMAALWVLVARPGSLAAGAAAGLLMSLATLTRSNLGIVAVAFTVWFGVASLRPSLGVRRWAALAFVVAGLTPPVLLALIYWRADALPWLRLATIDVPLSYANLTLSEIGWRTLLNGWGFLLQNWREPLLFMPFTLATMVGLAVSVHDYGMSSPQRSQPAHGKPPVHTRHELEWLTLGAVVVSVPMTGTFHHYWLQVFPICAVFSAYGLAWMLSKPRLRRIGYVLPAVALVGALAQTLPSAIKLATVPGTTSEKHTVRAAARAIAADRRQGDTVWAFRRHLVYWYLDAGPLEAGRKPTSPIVHSNLLTEERVMAPLVAAGYVDEDELRRILSLRPTYLVTKVDASGNPVPPYARGKAYAVADFLADHYRVFYDDGPSPPSGRRTRVYKLREEAT